MIPLSRMAFAPRAHLDRIKANEFDMSFGGILVATSVLLAKPLSFLFL